MLGPAEYVTWDLIPATLVLTAGFVTPSYSVILRKDTTQLFQYILSGILKRREYVFKQIIEHDITPES